MSPRSNNISVLSDRYELRDQLGAGGMAEVFLGKDRVLGRTVAVKTLLAQYGGDPHFIERFRLEAQHAAALNHPNIVSVYDTGSDDGTHYIVMEYVEGKTLRDIIREEGPLLPERVAEIGADVCAGLAFAHSHGIVHRDIKPANIMVTTAGGVKVADFGIARAVSGDTVTQTAMVLGTAQYFSPEQAQSAPVDARSDIYSLASVLYEMLAGEPPHTGPTVQSVIAKVLTDRPRPLRALRDAVPPPLESAVQKALAKVPADRFASAAQFAEALTHSSATGTLEVATAGEHRPRARGVAIVPWALAVLATGAAAWAWLRPAPRPPAVPVVRFSLSFENGFQPTDFRGSPIALAPDGSRIVYAGTDSLGTRWLFSRGFARVEPALIPGTAGAGQPFFSPDGQSIGFWQDGRLRKLSLSGGAVVTICEVPSVEGATWGVGDEIVFAASGPLYRVSAAGGKPEVFAAPDTAGGQAYRWPEFLPDGRTVLLTLVDGSGPHLAVLQGGRVRALGQTGMSPHYVDGGFILFAQTDGTLFAAPFDPRRGRFTGPPGPVVEGVRIGQLAVAKLGASRTGSLVFITGSTAPRELVLVDRAGHAQTLPAPLERYRAPRFSPDGRRIAVAIEHGAGGIFSADIWVYELGARNLSRLTFDSVNMFPEWARDGRQVAFVRQLGAITREGLFRIAADGSGVAETLLVRPYPVWEVQFTPDGRTMLFRENHPQTHRDIWITPVDSPRAARPLLRTPFEERGIGLSPDGRWLVYVSNETGADEIYIRQLREGSARWRVSTRGGTEARWGRVGRELFFRKGDTVYAVTTQLGAEVRLGAPRALFTGKYQAAVLGQSGQNVLYDVSPDGGRFLMVREQNSGNGEQLTVVLNWFDQVRRRGTAAAP